MAMRLQRITRLLGLGAARISAGAAALVVGLLTTAYTPDANAVVSFARQTGFSCFACHTRPPSMTAIGMRFFLQGYRIPHVRETLEHGEPGEQGGRVNISVDHYQWWRIRSTPLMKREGKLDVNPENRDKWFSTLVTRFSWGFGGPIGDYVAVYNEIYYQPQSTDPDRFVPPGGGPNADSKADWRNSIVEVDELEIVFGAELQSLNPGNYFGFYLNDRGYRKVNNRGGTAIYGSLSGADTGNGGVGVFAFWNDKWYLNAHIMPGSSVNWDKKDFQFNAAWWPFNSQQNNLWVEYLYTDARDSNPTASRTSFGTTNTKKKGQAHDFRVIWQKVDWGMHTIDTEFGIGWIKEKNNQGTVSANTFEGSRTGGGARYWYNRKYGAEFICSKWLQYEETSDVTGNTVGWKKPEIQCAYGVMYQVAANILWSLEYAENKGGPVRPGAAEPDLFNTIQLKLEIGF
jgi:hypothetical protein